MDRSDQLERAVKYTQLSQPALTPTSSIGCGTDGAVWRSSRNTAIKAFERIGGYYNERVIDFNDDLWVVEMQIVVNKPYIIDFAKVRIDRPPDFSEEVLQEEDAKGQELFGHHWPEVCQVVATLESYGIYYLDPQLGNIVFEDLIG